ncbi:hypothetical protein PV08_07943 [Exophiala spinifera]|uniref:Cytochrome P450 oxidoreductase n=1 Tax=Exophiala spinifera TaxID=91928 RepID=A0A0D1ZIS3_9EURO|nr:uncharacterized protein PV08_07943 [Exophiala spinifera]KIW12757.1 hypothetical protein PV08_07943 [Exophiala spinifera]
MNLQHDGFSWSHLLRYLSWAAASFLVAQVALFLYRAFTSPLRSVPGPLLARFGRIYYFVRVSLGRWEREDIALHRRYGPVVRVGADLYSIDSPEVIKKVYGIGSKFPKSDWYDAWRHPDVNRLHLFPDRDMKRHAETRRRFQAMYSMSSLVSYEGYVDECAVIFRQKLNQFAETGETIDMAHWLQCYAFDVVGNITYSTRFGFMDEGKDVAGLMKALHDMLKYGTLVGVYASWHPLVFDIFSRLGLGGASGRNYLIQYVQDRLEQRKADNKANALQGISKGHATDAPMDFLEKLMIANQADPEKVTPGHVFLIGMGNIIAGSDTTAVSLSAILYNLLKYPNTMKKLRREIEEHCLNPEISFKESQSMPYLQAVMKEALRICPATGLPLWRVVPEGEGVEICGHYFPPGTTVGINTWCAHYNEDVFGPDAKEFRPERWLEAEKEGGERLKNMEAYYMPFGLGSRTCIGRHISTLEMSKLIPQIVRDFDFELIDPEGWDTENSWFIKPTNFRVQVKVRSQR